MESGSGEFTIHIDDIRHLPQEGSDTLTLIWVLKGSVDATTEEINRSLKDDSMLIIPRYQSWQLTGSADNVTLRLALAGRWLTRLDDDFFTHDYAIPDERAGRHPHCNELRHLLRQLLAATLLNPPFRYRLEANRWLAEILLLLSSRFRQSLSSSRRRNPQLSRRISQVVERIESGYRRRITLAEIAKAEFVSEAWLSRLFHKEMGVSFMQYITALRLEKAACALRQSPAPLHQIALDHGFASTRMMSDLFRRRFGVTPRNFRRTQQNVPCAPRPASPALQPVTADRIFSLLNEPQSQPWAAPLLTTRPVHEQRIELSPQQQAAPLPRPGLIVTLRELDDLLRHDVLRDLQHLSERITIDGIDIAEPFLSSRLFASGWDNPQITGYASWYQLQQVFNWIAARGWSVLLHTRLTSSCDRLNHFLRLAVNRFPAATTDRWRFVFHWSPQAEASPAWSRQRAIVYRYLPKSGIGLWYPFTADLLSPERCPLLKSAALCEADFLACSADANELLSPSQYDPRTLASTENYPSDKVGRILAALRQHGHSLPIWLLYWNTLTGNTLTTNGGFFRGALLMHNMLNLSVETARIGFWLNSGLQQESRSPDKLNTSSLALQHNHGLPRPVYWVLWLWQRLDGDVLMQDRDLLLLRRGNGYQLLVRNTVVFNPCLSSEEAFIQRFHQRYLITLAGISGTWRVKSYRFDLHNGALFPLLNALDSESGPDEEVLNWVRHRARPSLAVSDKQLQNDWQISVSLESNALILYEITPTIPLFSSAPDSESDDFYSG